MSAKSKKLKSKSSGCGEPHSPWHGPEGEFVNPDKQKKGSWSCTEKGQTSRRGRSKRFTKVPCGRKAREAGKNVRCHDGKVISEDLYSMIWGLVEAELRAQETKATEIVEEWQMLHVPTLIREFRRSISKTNDGLLDEEDCSRCIKNYLMSLNGAIRASKGELLDKK